MFSVAAAERRVYLVLTPFAESRRNPGGWYHSMSSRHVVLFVVKGLSE